MNNTNFAQLLQTIIYVVVVFVIPAVGYFLSNYLHQASSNLADQRKRNFVATLVRAAEQMLVSNDEKRAYVESRLTTVFPSLTVREKDALIEAAVLSLHTALGIYKSPVPADQPDVPAVGPDDHPAGEPPTPLT